MTHFTRSIVDIFVVINTCHIKKINPLPYSIQRPTKTQFHNCSSLFSKSSFWACKKLICSEISLEFLPSANYFWSKSKTTATLANPVVSNIDSNIDSNGTFAIIFAHISQLEMAQIFTERSRITIFHGIHTSTKPCLKYNQTC